MKIVVCTDAVDVEAVLSSHWQDVFGPEPEVLRAASSEELARLLQTLRLEGLRSFPIRTTAGVQMVCPTDILLCRAEGHRFRLWLKDGRELLSRTTRQSFAQNTAPLKKTGLFLHAGATVLVNTSAITVIRDGHIRLTNGLWFPFSARWQVEAERQLSFNGFGRLGDEA